MAGAHVRVVAAVIARDDRYLITQRRPAAVLAGLWEFPGGKVEEGETDLQALKREVRERVGVEIEGGACIGRRTHDYDGYSVIFEYDHVVDTVQHGNPAPIAVYDGLAGGPPR